MSVLRDTISSGSDLDLLFRDKEEEEEKTELLLWLRFVSFYLELLGMIVQDSLELLTEASFLTK